MPKSRIRKRQPAERPVRKPTWWRRNWRYIDSGVSSGCVPVVGLIVLSLDWLVR